MEKEKKEAARIIRYYYINKPTQRRKSSFRIIHSPLRNNMHKHTQSRRNKNAELRLLYTKRANN